MPTDDAIEWGREYTADEVTALHPDRRPQPVRPYPIATPADGQGRGLLRRSTRGDKWCPFCQTVLNPTQRAQSCVRCKPRRERALDSARQLSGTTTAPSPSQQNFRDIRKLLECIDEMSRVVGVAYSMRARNGGMAPEHSEGILVACKDVMVASDDLRRRLRTPDPQ